MKQYKIIYHVGEAINLKTNISTGKIKIVGAFPEIISKRNTPILKLDSIEKVENILLNGLGHILKIKNGGQTIYIAAYRICIGNLIAITNMIGTKKLENELKNFL